MSKREQARIEAAFMRGDTGVDGGATEEKQDEAEVERAKAREALLRGRAYLGREFLTWLLWRSESGDALCQYEKTDVVPLFTGRIVLRGIKGDVNELSARGSLAPYSGEVRHALDNGLLVKRGEHRLEQLRRLGAVEAEQYLGREGGRRGGLVPRAGTGRSQVVGGRSSRKSEQVEIGDGLSVLRSLLA